MKRINRGEFGRQVTGSPRMVAHLRGLGARVAAVTGGRVESRIAPAAGGGSRARITVVTSVPMRQEARTGEVLAAARRVLSSAGRTL